MKTSILFSYRLIFSLFAAYFLGCGGEGEEVGMESAEDLDSESKGIIGVSVLTMGNPFFSVIANTITSEAASHGYEVIVVDGDRDVQKQANQIDDFITKGVSAIILNPCDRILSLIHI